MACPAAVVALYWFATSLFGKLCGLSVGLNRGCGKGTAIHCALTKRQLDYFETLGWQFRGACYGLKSARLC